MAVAGSAETTERQSLRAVFVHRINGSMGQVGSAGDDAAVESFFNLLQNNVLPPTDFETIVTTIATQAA